MRSRHRFRWSVPLFAMGVFATCPRLVAQTLDNPPVRRTAPDSSSFANPLFRLSTGLADRRALPGFASWAQPVDVERVRTGPEEPLPLPSASVLRRTYVRQEACSYAKCGLALSLAPFQLLRGNDLEPLGRTYFGPDVHVLLDAGGAVAEHTKRFQRYNTAQYVVMYSSVALLAVAFAVFKHDDTNLLVSAVGIGGSSFVIRDQLRAQGLSQLNIAILLYNGRFFAKE